MNLMDTAQLLGNFGEFVGAIAVVATLIYLAIQIRQNSVQVRVNSFQISTERYAELIANVLDDPVRFAWFKDGLESYRSLDLEKQAQFHVHLVRALNSYRNNVELMKAGAIAESVLMEQKMDIARILKCPGSREWARSVALEPQARVQWDAQIDDILSVGEDLVPLNEVLPFLKKQVRSTS